MRIVPYKSLYFNRCLSILKSNTPEFIDKSEESLFINYLSRKGIIYFVLFESRKLIGCGGYGYVDKKDSVIIFLILFIRVNTLLYILQIRT